MCALQLPETVTERVAVLLLPLLLSVTVSATVYVPADAKVWLGFAAVDVAPSPKFQECAPSVPPASVDVSAKATVRPFAVNVKPAVGVPPLSGAVTVTERVDVLLLPLLLSVTVSETL